MAIGSIFTHFLNRNKTTEKVNIPQLNVGMTPLDSRAIISSSIMNNGKKSLMEWYKYKSGLLTGFINNIADDINEQVFFEPTDKKDGRNRIKKANQFYSDNLLRDMFLSQIIDVLVTGEGYGYISNVDANIVKKEASVYLESKGLPNTESMRNLLVKANFPDEVDLLARKLRYVASSTMFNVYDRYAIRDYIQKVGVNESKFKLNEIIHIKFYGVDGLPDGFTPLTSLLPQLELEYFMWQNMVAISKNSGHPDRIYNFKNLDMNSPTYKRMEEMLKSYLNYRSRHGSMLMGGELDVIDLNQIDAMQFAQLGFYVTGIMAHQWRYPKSDIPFISKDTNTSEDTGGNSEKKYYGKIESFQDRFCAIYNQQFWLPYFGVEMRFRKAYKMDEIRETQAKQMSLNNLTFIQNELGRVGKTLTPEYVTRYINGTIEPIEDDDLTETPDPMEDNSSMRQGLQSDNTMTDNSKKSNTRAKKKDEQLANNTSKGTSTGLGKESSRVGFLNFVELNKDQKVYRAPSGDFTRFASLDYKTETLVPNSMITDFNIKQFKSIKEVTEPELLSNLI